MKLVEWYYRIKWKWLYGRKGYTIFVCHPGEESKQICGKKINLEEVE